MRAEIASAPLLGDAYVCTHASSHGLTVLRTQILAHALINEFDSAINCPHDDVDGA